MNPDVRLRMRRRVTPLGLLLLLLLAAAGVRPAHARGEAYQRQPDGVVIGVGGGWLELQVRAANVVRVAFAPNRAFFARHSPDVLPPDGPPPSWSAAQDARAITLRTAVVQVRVDRQTGAVAFLTAAGAPIVAEAAAGRTLEPAYVQGERVLHVGQEWTPHAGEALYGLGQQQLGVVDIRDYDLDLWQHNGTVVVPFLVSSRGYGILWDNPSYSRFGDRRPFAPIPAASLSDADGRPGAVTATWFADAQLKHAVARSRAEDIAVELSAGTAAPNTAIHPALPATGAVAVRWEGSFQAPVAGTYRFQAYAGNGVKVWIDDRLQISNWWEGWIPYAQQAVVPLAAGRHRLRVEWVRDQSAGVVRLRWKPPPAEKRAISLWSEVGQGIDYTLVYGPALDRVIAGYRMLTGRASLLPEWAFGLWQSRQRYETAQQSLDVLAGYRRRHLPIDVIVQDWFYWRKGEWGSHAFDPARFPDPAGWIRAIHDQYHAHIMISVWGKFYPGTANFEALQRHGFLYQPLLWAGVRDWLGYRYTYYDAFNPAARVLYWDQIRRALYTKGIDAWWLDASEPEVSAPADLAEQKLRMNPTAAGIGAGVLNAYALMNSRAVYEGQRAAAPDRRVLILTRSGFAGIQRYASATWSGDVPSTWGSLRRQIAAGLGYSISGLPYWSMDVGGFTAPPRFLGPKLSPAAQDEWDELNARWFEFGTFVPLLRLHGESRPREPWAFGGDGGPAERAIARFDRLRYQLLPYIYSLAGAVMRRGATMMRPLVMDFPSDPVARDCADEYLFGPALLVAPVTTYRARERGVYLPATTGGWYDFWTGAPAPGGATVTAAAPFDRIPVYVRAGSIVPFGPEHQYAMDRPADPLTLHVYPGADGAFTLYEDDGVSYAYEHGACSEIPIRWDDQHHTLELGARRGHFPGMLAQRTFRVALVKGGRPVGPGENAPAGVTLVYDGRARRVTLQ